MANQLITLTDQLMSNFHLPVWPSGQNVVVKALYTVGLLIFLAIHLIGGGNVLLMSLNTMCSAALFVVYQKKSTLDQPVYEILMKSLQLWLFNTLRGSYLHGLRHQVSYTALSSHFYNR